MRAFTSATLRFCASCITTQKLRDSTADIQTRVLPCTSNAWQCQRSGMIPLCIILHTRPNMMPDPRSNEF